MDHLQKFNEVFGEPVNLTEEDKKYFDLVFADFIDKGSKSKLTENTIYGIKDSESFTKTQIGYQINISITNLIKMKSPTTRIDHLLKYINEINEYTLEIQECINKIKDEYGVREHIEVDRDSPEMVKCRYREISSLTPFNMIISLFQVDK